MKNFVVRYSIAGYVYETIVKTSSSTAAILWAQNLIGTSNNISIVEECHD